MHALATLQPTTQDEQAKILALFGLGAARTGAHEPAKRPGPKTSTAPASSSGAKPTPAKPKDPAPEAPAARTAQESELEVISTQGGIAAPDWLHDVAPLATDRPILPAYRKPIAPLLHPRRSRALLTELLSHRAATGAIDTAKLVRLMATAQPVRSLPVKTQMRAAARVQLLLDEGKVMAPFALDVQSLAASVAAVMGYAGTQVGYFSDHPDQGLVSALSGISEPYTPPAAGTPVLAATLLYDQTQVQVQAHQMAAWRRFAAKLGARGSALVLLVIGPDSAVTAARRMGLTALPWDRGLTVQALKKHLGNR